jgi:hypothetical protein
MRLLVTTAEPISGELLRSVTGGLLPDAEAAAVRERFRVVDVGAISRR